MTRCSGILYFDWHNGQVTCLDRVFLGGVSCPFVAVVFPMRIYKLKTEINNCASFLTVDSGLHAHTSWMVFLPVE